MPINAQPTNVGGATAFAVNTDEVRELRRDAKRS